MNDAAVGQSFVRKDGREKVTGSAKYSADWPEPSVAYGVIFQSEIASGKVRSFNLDQAKKVQGVVEILTYENAPRIRASSALKAMKIGDPELPLQNAKIYYNGQPLGVVIAESLEAAEQAAKLVRISYREEEAQLGFQVKLGTMAKLMKKDSMGRTVTVQKGDIDQGIEDSDIVIHHSYTLPIENHHPMETSSTLAIWDESGKNKKLKVYDATQGVANVSEVLGHVFDLKKDDIQVITKFVGGGFGCKGATWSHVFIAVMAAQKTKRAVKLVNSRVQMATNVGYRSCTVQDVTLGCDPSGKLMAIKHETVNPTSMVKDYPETTGALFKLLYQADAISTTQKVVKLNYPLPTFMRAPGESSGSFALESAMDELAHELKMDPIELRLRNYAEKDPVAGIPFSSKSLKECYEQGAKEFGWDQRLAKPRSRRQGDYFIGYGMATSSYPVNCFPASARVELTSDGRARVVSATQDIGTGTYTVMTQLAADAMGLRYDQVSFDLGDSRYPAAGVSGGSSTVSSVGWAISEASKDLLKQLKELAVKDEASPLHGLKADDISSGDAKLFATQDASRVDPYTEIMKRAKKERVIGEGKINLVKQQLGEKKFSQHSYGAQFAEVKVHALTGEVTLVKMVGAFAAGRIVNPKTARSQFMGGMIFGIGMGLTEHNLVDERTGKFMQRDLAEYHVPVSKDVPHLEILMIDEKDTVVNPAGTKGIGEIGTVGTAAAIANAVFNATGVRIRDLPITPDKLHGVG